MPKFMLQDQVTRAPEDGGGAAAPAAIAPSLATPSGQQPDGGAPAAPAAGGAQPGASASPPPAEAWRTGLPEHLLGQTAEETVSKVFKAYDGSRQALSQLGEMPKDADGYQFQPSEAAQPYMKEFEQNDFFKGLKKAAFEAGVRAPQFQKFLGSAIDALIAGGHVADPFDAATESALIAGEIADPVQRAKEVDRRVRENAAWLDGLAAQNVVPKETATYLSGLLDRGHVNVLLSALRGKIGGETLPALGGSPAGATSREALRARQADPRNNAQSPKFDPAYARETDRLYQQLFADQA